MSEDQEYSQEELNKALFAQLVMMFATSALQHLGRVPNQATNQTHVDLEAAQTTIDLLDMLALKTSGNLDKEEEQMLTEALSSLKMNYVEVQQSSGATPTEPSTTEKPSAPPVETSGETPLVEPSSPKDDGSDDKQPKFHKSYD